MRSGSNNEIDEIELWEKFRSGDKDALVSIYERFQQPLANYGFQFTRDGELIKDCIHELFTSLFAKSSNPNSTTSVKFYLFRSLRRLLSREATRKQKSLWRETEYFEDSSFKISLSPETIIIKQETSEAQIIQLQKAVNELPIRQREAVFYFFYEGFSYKEITEIMGFKEVKTTRTLIYRALNSLRDDISSENDGKFDLFALLFLLYESMEINQELIRM